MKQQTRIDPEESVAGDARPWAFLTRHAQVLLCIASDPEVRLRHMDESGVAAEVVFAGGQNFEELPFMGKGWNAGLAGVRTELRSSAQVIWNRWLAEFITASPTRLMGVLQNPVWDIDLAVMKNTRIRENFVIQFRAETFNLLNHPDFDLPNPSLFTLGATGTAIPNPLAGQITDTINAPRQIQFALKLLF